MARRTEGAGGRGFAGMDSQKQRDIARKGGQAVSRDRQHMSEIGRRGGERSHGGGRTSLQSRRGGAPGQEGTSNLDTGLGGSQSIGGASEFGGLTGER
jgi:general stress protein YciG